MVAVDREMEVTARDYPAGRLSSPSFLKRVNALRRSAKRDRQKSWPMVWYILDIIFWFQILLQYISSLILVIQVLLQLGEMYTVGLIMLFTSRVANNM